MGRGVSAGGGQSSLAYLFGSGEALKPTEHKGGAATKLPDTSDGTSHKSTASVPQVDVTKQIPAGIQGSQANNYFCTDGQNSSNFITDRPSTKVQAAPGGGSSLGYLFGGRGNGNWCARSPMSHQSLSRNFS